MLLCHTHKFSKKINKIKGVHNNQIVQSLNRMNDEMTAKNM